MTSSADIATRIVDAVLSGRLEPGTRLGEQQLALLFDVSRTIVREALMRLTARGIVTVSARRGWYVIEPSPEEAREAFEARRVIELGLLHQLDKIPAPAVRRLKAHIAREKAAVKGDDVGARSFLLGDFHVCLAECLGNGLIADTLRDLTARTTLIAMLYQSSHEAAQSCAEHVQIVDALSSGDLNRAQMLMAEHLHAVEAGLREQQPAGALDRLRDALAPADAARRRRPRSRTASESDDPLRSTYLGEVL